MSAPTADNARGLYIPPAVLAVPRSVSWPALALLAEVVNLYQVKGSVFAENDYFMERVRLTRRAVDRALNELEDAGLIHRDTKQNRKPKRLLTPLLPIEPCAKLAQGDNEPNDGLAQGLATDWREPNDGLAHINKKEIKKESKEGKGAAPAASSTSSLSAENSVSPTTTSPPTPAAKKSRKAGPPHAEIAALVLPHPGPDFAATWHTFYTQNTKQAGKPLSAFELMLKKLGKYPEGFAVEMLEAAIQGNWSGVENGGTAQRYTEWQAQQANRPTPPPAPAPRPAPDLNHELIAEQNAAAAAALQVRLNHYATTS